MGKCGKHLEFETRWHTLVIRGTGEVVFPAESSTWQELACYIRDVEIMPGCTGLGNGLFSGWRHLESIRFPDTLQFIGDRCFEGCISLRYVHLPAGITLGNSCFRDCVSLESIRLPSGIQFGGACFRDCRLLSFPFFAEEPERALLEEAFPGCPVVFRTADEIPDFRSKPFYESCTNWDEEPSSWSTYYVPKDCFYQLGCGPVKYTGEEQSFYLPQGGSLKILHRFGTTGICYKST